MYHLNIYAIPYLVCSIYVLAIGFFIYELNPSSSVNLSFLIQCVMVAIWQAGTFFGLSSTDEKTAIFWAHFAYAGVVLVSVATYSFIVNFLDFWKQRHWIKWGYVGMTFLFFPLLPGPYLIAGLYKYSWGYWYKAGEWHPVFVTVFSIWMMMNFLNLYRGIRIAKGTEEEKRRRLLFWAYIIAYFAALEFIPDYGYPIYPCGFIPVIIYMTIYAFAIEYHELKATEEL